MLIDFIPDTNSVRNALSNHGQFRDRPPVRCPLQLKAQAVLPEEVKLFGHHCPAASLHDGKQVAAIDEAVGVVRYFGVLQAKAELLAEGFHGELGQMRGIALVEGAVIASNGQSGG